MIILYSLFRQGESPMSSSVEYGDNRDYKVDVVDISLEIGRLRDRSAADGRIAADITLPTDWPAWPLQPDGLWL